MAKVRERLIKEQCYSCWDCCTVQPGTPDTEAGDVRRNDLPEYFDPDQIDWDSLRSGGDPVCRNCGSITEDDYEQFEVGARAYECVNCELLHGDAGSAAECCDEE